MKLFSTIKDKLIFFTLTLSLVPLIVITITYYINSSSTLKSHIIGELTAIAEAKKLHILTFMKAKKERVIDFSSDGFIKDKLKKTAHGRTLRLNEIAQLNNHLSTNKMPLDSSILSITIIGKNGNVLSSTNEVLIGEDISFEETFIQVVNKSQSDFFISQPYYSPYLERNCILISTPLTSRIDGETLGVMSVAFDINALNEIACNRAGMGNSGEIYLVNRDRLMLTRSRFIENEPFKLMVDTEPVRKITGNGKEMAGIYRDYRNVPVVGSSVYIPEHDWILLVEMDKAEVFAPVKKLAITAWFIGVIGTVAVAIVGVIFARSASRPIVSLRNAAEIFSSGNLDYRAEATRKDEIGELTRSFNNMAEKLQKTYEKDRQLIASIPSILISVDADDKVVEWNKAAGYVFGIPSADVVGKPFSECGVQWNDKNVIKQILDSRNRTLPTHMEDIRFKKPRGEAGFLSITVNPIKAVNGRAATLLILGSDITQRKILENQLVQSQKLESIGQLAAGIAHEINTPTQYVGDNTRFLQDAFNDFCKFIYRYKDICKACKTGAAKDALLLEIEAVEKEVDVEYLVEEIPKAIKQSLDGIDRVTKIVRAMKEFSHPGTDEKTYIDINKAIESTITVARNEWKYVADMETHFDTLLPLVPCFPDEFNQVILNIIINAAHAINDVVCKGTNGNGTITVSTHRDGTWAEVRIKDTGTGIPEAVRSKIFEPFFTTKEVGKGTGQGLTLAHAIVVKKHGGTITFETEEGKGTTFIIRLPVG